MSFRKIIFCLLFIITAEFGITCYAAGPTTIDAKLDSVAILMGKQTVLTYQIVQDKNVKGHFLIDSGPITPNVEIIGTPQSDTIDLGNNRIQIDRKMIIQSFDSGIWEIPGAKYIVGNDTIYSKSLNLKVIPINVDTLKTVNGFKDVEEAPRFITDYLPDFIYYYWWIIVLAVLLIAGAIFIYLKKKKGQPIISIKKKEIPPYEEAVDSLNHLKAAKLWQEGKDKEYFTALTDILRKYIDRRFQINAIEMTSSQILDTLKKNEETKAVNEHLQQILDVADYVKFANVRPLPDDSEASWNKAMNFVEETKPVVEENPNEKNDKAQTKHRNKN